MDRTVHYPCNLKVPRQLDRDIDFIAGVEEGTMEVKEIVEKALARVERAMESG